MKPELASLPRGTVTFLFTDIEGSTDLVRRLRERYGDIRAGHARVLEQAFGAFGGRVIDTQGDALFVAFERATEAVAGAVSAQRALAGAEWPDGTQVRVRMGLHTAEPFLHEAGYVGIGVHRAARICAAAHGGQILVSNATAGIVEDQELPDLELRDLGEYRLKDISAPQRLYEVVAEGLGRGFAPPKAAGRDERPSPYGRAGTLLTTDIVGWSRTMRRLGDEGAAAVASAYHDLVREAVEAHAGRTLEATGDQVICVFERARDALACAARARAELGQRDWGADVRLDVRAALHTGRIVAEGHGGIAIVHCLELCATAEPGQVLVSHATEALLEGEVLDGFELRDLGERHLRSFDTPSRVFELMG